MFDTATLVLMGLIGFVALTIGSAVLYTTKRGTSVVGWGGIIAGVALIGFAVASPTLFPATTTPVTSGVGNGGTIQTTLGSQVAIQQGCTWYQNTQTLACTGEYNVTSHAFCTNLTFAATHGCGAVGTTGKAKGYISFPLSLARTDGVNRTFAFPVTFASIYTANSLGATPTLYSPLVGYTAATSTVPGTWQCYVSAGTLAKQNPTVSAPSVATNVLTSSVPVNSFSSTAVNIELTLPGYNSTSAPQTFAQALTNYTAYPVVLNIGGSTPSTLTITYTVIGWTT